MKLLQLECHNVFSIGDAAINLMDRGLTLITGFSHDEGSSNAAGKSSLCNKSIIWGLYGKTASKDGADSVVNRHLNKEALVSIWFIGVDGNSYRVTRQRNPNKLEFISKTTDLTRRKESETQELINKALGRDWKTFLFADFFGQGRRQSFLELRGQEQKEIIEEILPLEQLSEWHQNSKDAYKRVVDSLKITYEQLNNINTRRSTLEEQLGLNLDREKRWDIDQNIKIRDVESKLSTVNQEAIHKEKELENLIDSVALDISKYYMQNPLDAYEKNRIRGESELQKINIKRIAHDKDIDFLEKEISSLESSIKNTICFLCKQPIPDIINMEEQYSTYVLDLGAAKSARDIVRENQDDASANVEYWAIASKFVKQKKDHIDQVLTEAAQLKRLIDSIKSDSLNIQLEELKKETNPYTPIVVSLQLSIDDLSKEKNRTEIHSRKLDKDKKWIEFWENAFSKDIRNLLFEEVCPFLENKTNGYLVELNNGQLKARFNTTKHLKSGDTKEEFTVTVDSTTGGEVYSLLSGGEQQLVSFAINLALADLAESQVKGNSQILILDEPFQNLSPQNCENLIDFLTQKLNKRKSTILLVSNEDELKNLIPNRIHVEKRNGISSIVGV